MDPLPNDGRPAPEVLRVDDLTVAYGSRVVVSGLSFAVAQGEIVGLLGPNGAGKTSTLSVVEGLRRPAGGGVTIAGRDVVAHPRETKALLGVQLQRSGFQPELTVQQLLCLYAGVYGVPLTPRAALDALGDIGLREESGKRFAKLSGGQQQRFALLIAGIHDPLVMVLDEPTSGLDPQSRRSLWDRIEDSRRRGRSVLLTTHSMEEAQAVCDRIVIIDHGSLVAEGSPDELIAAHHDDPRVLAVAHGEPSLEDVFIALTGRQIRD